MPDIGPLELVIILVIVLVIVGPKKLPGLGRSLGGGMREFKDSLTGDKKDDDPSELQPPAAAQAPVQPVTQQVPVQQQAPPPATPVAPAPVDPSQQAAPPAAPAPPQSSTE